jgi:hypothetical protein
LNELALVFDIRSALGHVPLGNLKMIEEHLAVHVRTNRGLPTMERIDLAQTQP